MQPLRLRPAWTLLPVRLAVGVGFLSHGVAKWGRGPERFARLLQYIGAPFPVPTAWAVTFLEVFGGLAILAGVFVAIVSVPLIGTMLVATLTIHIHYGFSSVNTIGLTAAGPVFGPPGYEINTIYVAALLALCVSEPTVASVDAWLARRRLTAAVDAAAASSVDDGIGVDQDGR